jgi:tellurite methyltransferase
VDSERLLDIRDAALFAAGHIPGSVNIPAAELAARAYELPPPERALVVCAADPAEAARVAAELRARGHPHCAPRAEPVARWPGPWETGPGTGVLWEPSPTVARWADSIPPGPVLDLGCGAGRDAVHLAERGHAVTAVDRLPDALERAALLARRRRVELTLVRADLRRPAPPLPEAMFAAVTMIRLRAPALFPWIAAHVRPGGLFLHETIAPGGSYDAWPGWTVLDSGQDDPIAWLVLRRREGDDPDHD